MDFFFFFHTQREKKKIKKIGEFFFWVPLRNRVEGLEVLGKFSYECVLSLKRERHPRVFPNLKRTQEHASMGTSLPLCKQTLFCFLAFFSFLRKEIFSWEHGNI
jgi:hypothetical protein